MSVMVELVLVVVVVVELRQPRLPVFLLLDPRGINCSVTSTVF